MMGKYYHKKTDRSKRKMHHFDNNAVTVSLANGEASFHMVLPMIFNFPQIFVVFLLNPLCCTLFFAADKL